MSAKANERLLDMIGDVDERYIREYIDARAKAQRPRRMKMRHTLILAAAMIMLLGTVSLAAVPVLGHFLENFRAEQQIAMRNFDEIEAKYAVLINDTQECGGVTGTLNSAVVEEHHLLLSYTFDWSGLEEAADGSFHTYFLPWFFYITEGDTVICQSEYTKGLHTQTYMEDTDGNIAGATHIYCIDLNDVDGRDLVGKELTVQLLYAQNGEGFSSAFTPETCFSGRSWDIDKSYEFEGHEIRINRVRESALYVTLFIDCDTIGHNGDDYAFILSDELGNDYTAYPNGDNDTDGYWFTKPETVGGQLNLKVIRSSMESDPYGQITDDSYEVLYEIPIELKKSFWDDLF